MEKEVMVDVDGVCVDFTGHVLARLGSQLGEADITSWAIEDHLASIEPHLAPRFFEVCSSDGAFWRSIPAIEGAAEGLDRIRAAGLRVVFLTSPWYAFPEWEHARRDLLARRFGASEHDVLPLSRKHRVPGLGFLDDKPEHVARWGAAHGAARAFLFDRPHNRGLDHPRRVTWASIDRFVEAALEDPRHLHVYKPGDVCAGCGRSRP